MEEGSDNIYQRRHDSPEQYETFCCSVQSLSKPVPEAGQRRPSLVKAASKRCPSASKEEPNAVQALSKPPTFLSKRLSGSAKTLTFRVQDSVPSTLIIILKGEEGWGGVGKQRIAEARF